MADQVRIVIIFYNPNMGGTADHFVPCILRNTRDFSCRALNENEPKAKFEFSANGTSALNEGERGEDRI